MVSFVIEKYCANLKKTNYCTATRPAMLLSGTECLVVKSWLESKLGVAEIRMLQ